jgi:hypothetical protein
MEITPDGHNAQLHSVVTCLVIIHAGICPTTGLDMPIEVIVIPIQTRPFHADDDRRVRIDTVALSQ